MKPLVTIQRVLTWLCAFVDDKPTHLWKRSAFVMFTLLVFVGMVSAIMSSMIFVWKTLSTDLEQSLCALFQVFGSIVVLSLIIIGVLMRHKITATINRLSQIYDQSKTEDSFCYLEQANNKSEWLCGAYFLYIVGGFPVSAVATSIVSVVVCFLINGRFESNNVLRPTRLILPWNQTSPLGYFSEMCYNIYVTEACLVTNGALILLFISICFHHQAFPKMFAHTLSQLDRSQKDQKNKQILCKLIQFHVSVKDWFLESTKIYSPVVLVELICYTGHAACTVFQLDMNIKHMDFRISITIMAIFTGFSALFLCCFFGKLATESFLEMAESLYESNWYEHPIALQKHFILLMANTQKPIYYHGFTIAILNLETFLKVVKAIYTYYMVCKTLTM